MRMGRIIRSVCDSLTYGTAVIIVYMIIIFATKATLLAQSSFNYCPRINEFTPLIIIRLKGRAYKSDRPIHDYREITNIVVEIENSNIG
jgi:hypothetical protein